MSLINEALKRARVEAARRDAAAKGVPPSALPVYVPRRRRPWLAPALGFFVGLAVFAVAAAGYWLARRPAPAAGGGAAASPPAPVAAAPAPPPVTAPAPSPVETAPAVAAEREAARPSASRPSASRPSAARPEAPPPIEPEAQAPASEPEVPAPASEPVAAVAASEPASRPAPQTAPRTTPADAEDGRVYSVVAQPPGGQRIKLDFIVWSETRPFAQLNGKQIHPGQTVDGYELLTVERDRVELERAGSTFWLRVR